MTIISVIVPCYNQGEYLSECLDSVSRQTYSDWECIIINDGSEDNTADIAGEYCRKDQRFKYLSKKNGGLAEARNSGIEMAIGRYILPLDADDKIKPEFLQKTFTAISCNDNVKIVYTDVQLFGTENDVWSEPEISLDKLLFRNYITATALYKKSDWLIAGGYDAAMNKGFEDWMFWLSLLKTGGTAVHINEPLFLYRRKSVSMSTGIDQEIAEELKRKIVRKHIDLYIQKFGDPLQLYSENQQLKSRLMKLENSKFFKTFKKIKSLIGRF